jgi:chromosome segregation ATPase
MGCIGKTVVRAGIITALVGGTAIVIAGPDRIGALARQARGSVNSAIDSKISDPVALRAQLRNLESQYPYRIEEVKGDLAELDVQITQLQRELEVSRLSASMADADLQQMQAVLTRAEEARESGVAQVVKVRFGEERPVNLEQAYAKATRQTQLRDAFGSKAGDIERDLGYLGQQRERLSGLLSQLETERAEFQTQLFALDRQVDAIGRNDRMITILQKRQDTIENHSRYRAASLDQVTARLADIRAKQEGKLQSLTQSTDIKNYENAAKYLLDSQRGKDLGLKRTGQAAPKAVEVGPSVIEIGPESVKSSPGAPALEKPGQIVSR